jgi:hypothetical protein
MRKILFLFVQVCFVLAVSGSAQTFDPYVHPMAITKNGVLVGNHAKPDINMDETDDAVNVKSMQSINSITGIYIDKENEIHTLAPAEFQMMIVHNADTTTLESLSPLLTNDMLSRLKSIVPGDVVGFQYIRMKLLPGSEYAPYASPMFFAVK